MSPSIAAVCVGEGDKPQTLLDWWRDNARLQARGRLGVTRLIYPAWRAEAGFPAWPKVFDQIRSCFDPWSGLPRGLQISIRSRNIALKDPILNGRL